VGEKKQKIRFLIKPRFMIDPVDILIMFMDFSHLEPLSLIFISVRNSIFAQMPISLASSCAQTLCDVCIGKTAVK
jgi:hypothetical protein